jgi:hypothetical protein
MDDRIRAHHKRIWFLTSVLGIGSGTLAAICMLASTPGAISASIPSAQAQHRVLAAAATAPAPNPPTNATPAASKHRFSPVAVSGILIVVGLAMASAERLYDRRQRRLRRIGARQPAI